MQNNRYPGVVSFKTEQQNIFFGRDNDIRQLSNLIRINEKTLLYSRSGIGKSSLLNAGVLPKLKDDFLPVSVRFFLYNEEEPVSPVERIKQTLQAYIKETSFAELDKIAADSQMHERLWYYIKRLEKITDKKILLVFDQFEELFSYPDELQKQFAEQLHEVSCGEIPETMFSLLAENEENGQKQDKFLYRIQAPVHIVFAIRFDYLSSMNSISNVFPDIQENFYELKALNTKQTRQAIVKPAGIESAAYTSPVFGFAPDAIDLVVNRLTGNGTKEAETTQLQLVCSEIEQIVIQRYAKGEKNIEIKTEDIPDFTDIFLRFYENSIARLTAEKHDTAKQFVEDNLIRNNRRVSLDKLVCTDFLTEKDLATLTNCHLLRSEPNSTGGESIELCQDTVI